jgi:hypothetical protein
VAPDRSAGIMEAVDSTSPDQSCHGAGRRKEEGESVAEVRICFGRRLLPVLDRLQEGKTRIRPTVELLRVPNLLRRRHRHRRSESDWRSTVEHQVRSLPAAIRRRCAVCEIGGEWVRLSVRAGRCCRPAARIAAEEVPTAVSMCEDVIPAFRIQPHADQRHTTACESI